MSPGGECVDEPSLERRDIGRRIDDAIALMANTGQRRPSTERLGDITMLAVRLLPGVDHAGITCVGEGVLIRSMAATDGHPLVLDNITRRVCEGPSLSAAYDGRPYRADDLTDDSRWPAFARQALVSTPVRAVVAVPVCLGAEVRAALNLYADNAGALEDGVEGTAELLARHIGLLMTGQSRRGSARRDVINQAKLLLMEKFGADVAQAYSLLVAMAKEQHDSIESVARLLVAGGPQDADNVN
ncbi:ANTAR domain-containing protein [Mycobacterium sp. NPDC050551]|uniref:ANTAR domain-containing protein n=1 Tax=Mycobacterium sp. NPDC050551 TaxID=3155407 RepID=UPI0034403026